MTVELELRGITKRFPGVVANDAIDLTVRSGDIHAIVGENGAGKSTLMSVLYGLVQPDSGTISLQGRPVHFSSPLDAIAAGLGMVHQSFQLFPSFSVAENVVFRSEPTRAGLVDRRGAVTAVNELAESYGLAVHAATPVEQLSVGELQRVEILKALYRDAGILILDEPTAVLTPQERDGLFDVLHRLRDDGRTILFITHKLAEVMAISDRVTVLRRGRVAADLATGHTDAPSISRHMTGRDVRLDQLPPSPRVGDPVVTVQDLRVTGDQDVDVVNGVDIEVHRGEIVGLAGVAGNGQAELVQALTGLREVASGSIHLDGVDITDAAVARRRRTGMAYIPEDRHGVGSAGGASIAANLAMGFHDGRKMATRGWIDPKALDAHARTLIDAYDIKATSTAVEVATLSGGNLQKVVVAREMAHRAPLLIAEQPTRGIDVGAIQFVHGQLQSFRDEGGAVLLVSAELSEIQALSTRILVMFEGRIVAELDPDQVDEAEIGLHMTGSAMSGPATGTSGGVVHA